MFYTMIRELSVPYLLDIDPQIYESMPLAVAAGANLVLIYRNLPRHKEVPVLRSLRPKLNAVHSTESQDPGPMVARLHLFARSR